MIEETAASPPSGLSPPDLAVVILTFNEARHIERAIACVRPIARDILVVDSFSTDGTEEIARRAGARVLQHPFTNYARQFQWALDRGQIKASWIMRVDADEVVEPDHVAQINARLPMLGPDVVGVTSDHKHIFMGRWIRHGGRYPLRLLRLWRRGHGRIEQRWMDEHMIVEGGRTIHFSGGFADVNLQDLAFFTDKHNRYATREALDVLIRKYRLVVPDIEPPEARLGRQARLKRWFKEQIYNRLPFWLGPLCYFLFRYIFQLGFLDGREGLIYHFLQGFWYRFLVGARLVEMERELADCHTNDTRRTRLQTLTGYKIDAAG